MITGSHVIVFSSDPEADRTFSLTCPNRTRSGRQHFGGAMNETFYAISLSPERYMTSRLRALLLAASY